MTRFALPAGIAALALLGACTQPETTVVVDTPPVDPADTCNAAGYQQYVGQQSPAITLPAGTVARDYRSGAEPAGEANPQRVNFEYDRSGTLVEVTCG